MIRSCTVTFNQKINVSVLSDRCAPLLVITCCFLVNLSHESRRSRGYFLTVILLHCVFDLYLAQLMVVMRASLSPWGLYNRQDALSAWNQPCVYSCCLCRPYWSTSRAETWRLSSVTDSADNRASCSERQAQSTNQMSAHCVNIRLA